MRWKRLAASLKNAARGLKHAWRTEQNFRIQAVGSLLVVLLAWIVGLRQWEKALVVVTLSLTLVMELLNTAVEYFIDLLQPRLHHYAEAIKDLMAAAVLVTSLMAGAVGLIVFLPYFIGWFK